MLCDMGPDESLIALPDHRAAKLATVSVRQLRYWEQVGLVVPSVRHQFSQRSIVRLYHFTDLVDLLVAAELRDALSLQHIRKVVDHLRGRGYPRPLSELRFAIVGNEIYFQHPDGQWEGEFQLYQPVLQNVLALEPIRARILGSMRRSEAAYGQVERQRGLRGGAEVFAGTRIPVQMVRRRLKHGFTPGQIIEAYPDLTLNDIEMVQATLSASA
jgi:DNA-binding transcriptional MerR regulator